MIAHFAQWILGGVTLSPVEPSEGMEFAKHGIVNTGLIFFVVAILVTAVFGRFFCGWGCHLIALQDLSRWLLIKIGIKPKPLRSRVLGLVPLVAFVYMFLWPAIYKIGVGQPLGPVSTEFLTTDFWATFPGVAVAVLTFAVCGFAVVFVLGSKGYCTYGCPYGAAFGIADRMAPVRIRVTDACQGCATCTSVCTSNVRVHEEVRDHGMVVDPGCMKCLDCVANCPNEALYVGAGRPALGRAGGRSAPGALRWSEEVLVGLAFVLGFVTFRGLYGLVPFLFALGIAAILAGLVLTSWRLSRDRDAWLGPIRLKSDGRFRRSGWVFVVVMVLITAFWAHSAVVQELTRRADRLFAQTAELRRTALEIQGSGSPMAESDRRLVSRARLAAERLDRWSPVASPDGELILAWTAFLDGDPAEAKIRVDRALRERPSEVSGHLLAGRLLVEDGRWQEAAGAYSRVVELDPADPAGYLGLGSVLGSSGRVRRSARGLHPGSGGRIRPRSNFDTTGVSPSPSSATLDGAAGEFERVLDLDPDFLPARENLAGVLAAAGRFSEAVPVFEEAVRRSPADPQLRIMAARACLEAGLRARAEDHIESAIGLDPSLEPARRLLD